MAEHFVRGTVNLIALLILGYMIKHNDVFSSKERRSGWGSGHRRCCRSNHNKLCCTQSSPPINMIFCAIGFGISPFIPLLMANEYFRGTLFFAYVIAYFFGISIFLFRTEHSDH